MAATAPSSSAALPLPQDEKLEIQEYEKIVRFRDSVLSGKHPKVKIPAHLVISKSNPATPVLPLHPTSSHTVNTKLPAARSTQSQDAAQEQNIEKNKQVFQANSQLPASIVAPNFPGLGSLSGPPSRSPAGASAKTIGAAQTEINPVLLEKSEDLIKAEIKLQRQRIERSLREEVEEQKRNSRRILMSAEQLPSFDLINVLERALLRVQHDTAALPTDTNRAASPSDSSDSFDNNTFYSSRFGTPDSHDLARVRTESAEVEMREGSHYEPQLDMAAATQQGEQLQPSTVQPSTHYSQDAHIAFQRQSNPHVAFSPPYDQVAPVRGTNIAGQMPRDQMDSAERLDLSEKSGRGMMSSDESGEASRSRSTGDTDNEQLADTESIRRDREQELDEAYEPAISPVVRVHELRPFAPQPSHVSPLAASRQATAAQSQPLDYAMALGTPAQVATLRSERTSALSSTDGSSRSNKAPEKRRNNKRKNNKRKADRLVADEVPFIKPEPGSPSLMNAPQFARPQKRARQTTEGQSQDVAYDEPRYEQAAGERHYEGYGALTARESNPAPSYERQDAYIPRRDVQPIVRYEQEHYDDGRLPPGVRVIQHGQAPAPYQGPYESDIRTVRSASYAVLEGQFRDSSAQYADSRALSRLSIRAVPSNQAHSRSPVMRNIPTPSTVVPMRAPPTRIVVDEFGREYIEPPRTVPPASIARLSLAPLSRPGPPGVSYEPMPPRAMSHMPASGVFEDSGVYAHPSPSFAAPRRVVTQPEYGESGYGAYHPREYLMRPAPPVANQYPQYHSLVDSRSINEAPREFNARAMSVRPAEPLRYQATAEYDTRRLQSARPEATVRDHASPMAGTFRQDIEPGMQPDARNDVVYPQPIPRSYSMVPAGPPAGQVMGREYGARPIEPQYYDRPPVRNDGVAYNGRPVNATQGVVYAGTCNIRRDGYH